MRSHASLTSAIEGGAARQPNMPSSNKTARPFAVRHDRVFRAAADPLEDFMFDEKVAAVFPDMIERSVPGYGALIPLLGIIAARHLQPESFCYDLGCSLGAASLAIHQTAGTRFDYRIIAVDNSLPMLRRFREILAEEPAVTRASIDLLCADIRSLPVTNASVVVLNFTLQFLPTEDRDAVLGSIWRGLRPGGVLILSEKHVCEEPEIETRFRDLHDAFKRNNGYSELEISRKRSALERVLRPDSLKTLEQRLRLAGFETGHPWFQCLNFVSFLAWKS